MLLQPFQHHRPACLDEAVELMARHGDAASFYAGGTELLLAMKARVLHYEHLIDLKRIDELRGIRASETEIVIGALSSHLSLARDATVRRILPTYARMSDGIANIRVRAQGTIGGNLCFGEPHADPPTLLSALDARLTLKGPQGTRTIPMREFVQGEFTTARAAEEILCDIRIPRPAAGACFAYHSFGHLERPAVSIAVGYVPEGSRPAYSVFAGALTSAPTELRELAQRLSGVPPEKLVDAVTAVAHEAVSDLDTHEDLLGSIAYKRHLAAVLVKRACAEIAAGAGKVRP